MSDQVRDYNPRRVLVLIGGIAMSGLGEGDFLGIEPMADTVTSKVGADGEVARSVSTDARHTVTLTLQQTSPSNDILSGFAAVDRLTCGGASFPLLVQDLCGRTMFATDKAWISRVPNVTFGIETGEREWQITTGTPSVYLIGGNV